MIEASATRMTSHVYTDSRIQMSKAQATRRQADAVGFPYEIGAVTISEHGLASLGKLYWDCIEPFSTKISSRILDRLISYPQRTDSANISNWIVEWQPILHIARISHVLHSLQGFNEHQSNNWSAVTNYLMTNSDLLPFLENFPQELTQIDIHAPFTLDHEKESEGFDEHLILRLEVRDLDFDAMTDMEERIFEKIIIPQANALRGRVIFSLGV